MPSTPESIASVRTPHARLDDARTAELSWMRGIVLSLRLLARDWRAGELRVLVIGLIIAVASFTTVAFFTDRVRQALSQEAGQLLGADLVVISDRPIDAAWEQQARDRGLETMRTVRFPSMTVYGEHTQLTEIKAVGAGYPLKGKLVIDDGKQAVQHPGIPPPGTVWADERLLARLSVGIGDSISVGARKFQIGARVSEDPGDQHQLSLSRTAVDHEPGGSRVDAADPGWQPRDLPPGICRLACRRYASCARASRVRRRRVNVWRTYATRGPKCAPRSSERKNFWGSRRCCR